MSRAFVREDDVVDDLPDRPISDHPNYVTFKGLAQITRAAELLRTALAQAQAKGDRDTLARVSRDLRYWDSRQSSAQVIQQPNNTDQIRFGHSVTLELPNGELRVWQIVGEDEADPSRGSLSYVAPLARALLGKSIGDVVRVADQEAEIIGVSV